MNKHFSISLLLIILLSFAACQEPNKEAKPPIIKDTQSATQDYIGLSLDNAQALANKKKVRFRVVKKDGEALMVSMDFVPNRINATVENGVVTRYTIEGYDQNSWKTVINPSCQRFFDGCNNCQRIKGASSAACTRKMCNGYEKPKCLDE